MPRLSDSIILFFHFLFLILSLQYSFTAHAMLDWLYCKTNSWKVEKDTIYYIKIIVWWYDFLWDASMQRPRNKWTFQWRTDWRGQNPGGTHPPVTYPMSRGGVIARAHPNRSCYVARLLNSVYYCLWNTKEKHVWYLWKPKFIKRANKYLTIYFIQNQSNN